MCQAESVPGQNTKMSKTKPVSLKAKPGLQYSQSVQSVPEISRGICSCENHWLSPNYIPGMCCRSLNTMMGKRTREHPLLTKSSPHSLKLEKSLHSDEDRAGPKIK